MTFMRYDLEYFDDETGRLEPIAKTHSSRSRLQAFGLFLAAILFLNNLSASSTGHGPPDVDSLVGVWTYSGRVPATVSIKLTFNADKTFTFVEDVAPFSRPAGSDPPNGCVTTHTYSGTYADTAAAGKSTLRLTFTSGTANAVSGCNAPALNSSGTPMTADDIGSYREQGLIPPATVTYSATSTALVLNPEVDHMNAVGLSAMGSITFTKID